MSTESPVIHVVEDDESVRSALLRLLDAAGFEAQGYASSGDFLLHLPHECLGCLLLDIRLPGGPSGLELQEALKRQGFPLPIIFLTGCADVLSSVRAMKAGAVDFLTKPVERALLLEALRRALSRNAFEQAEHVSADKLRARFALLTPRGRTVFEGIVNGKLNKQIADDLGVTERTIKAQRAQIMTRLGVSSAAELGSLAEQLRHLPSRQ